MFVSGCDFNLLFLKAPVLENGSKINLYGAVNFDMSWG